MNPTAGTPALTRNQNLVLSALARAEAPLSAYRILDELRGEGLRAPLQVYRALDKLIAYGLAHRIESLNAFVACASPAGHVGESAAFAICEDCGAVTEFADAVLKDRLLAWCGERGFTPLRTALELRGLCAACRPEGCPAG